VREALIRTVRTTGLADASQRQLMGRASTVGLLMRNCVNLLAAAVALADPESAARSPGKWLLLGLGLWSLYRVATRSQHGVLLAADYLLVLLVCLAVPALVFGPDFAVRNNAPVAIAGTSVIGFAVVLPARATLPMTVFLATAFACGSAATIGWAHVREIFNLYYFAVQWATAALIRVMLLRVAAAVDRARVKRQAAQLNQQVTTAVREFEREQLALLHDTAASTLLIVGQDASLPPQRLAAQARRDLKLLNEVPWVTPSLRIEVVAALHECAVHLSTATRFTGLREVWLDAQTAKAVVAASREAMNNVERHSRAGLLTISVSAEAVAFEDDGAGFDPDVPSGGHGIADSIVERMRRAGGDVAIDSAPGAGTRVALSWAQRGRLVERLPPGDPDQMIQRSRVRYGLALTTYAAANLFVMVPYAVIHGDHPAAQIVLAVISLASTLTAWTGIRLGRFRTGPLAAIALILVSIIQPQLLPVNELGGQHHWAQAAVGWCVLPLVLGLSMRTGAGLLLSSWVLGAAVELLREPSAGNMVNIGLGTASILGVQLFALAFNGLMRDAAADAQAETEARQRLVKRERVEEALRAEYQNRYAKLVENVVPLLEELSRGDPVSDDLQRRARVESRQLRVLFDQATTFDHSLMRQLRPLVDEAAARGIDVAVELVDKLPHLTDAEIAGLLAPLARVLDLATSRARVVMRTTPDEVTASIVCDQMPDVELLTERFSQGADDTDIVTADGTVWLLVRRQLYDRTTGHVAVENPSVSSVQSN
jgi:signal transduction histidine kinase